MREVVLDTETTGLEPSAGHRIVEIGCTELIQHIPTGETFQRYVDPERDMPIEAERVHGLTRAFLADQPRFSEIADDFLAFIGDDRLVIHNASFDLGFINAELERIGKPPIAPSRAIDTVSLARRKFPGAPASLDALCRRFGIDLSSRSKHGALLDAELLTEVYLELIGGRQPGLGLSRAVTAIRPDSQPASSTAPREPRVHQPTAAEAAAHAAFIATLDAPIWLA
jgi:DNA polymerase-3 subunit epsilon